MGYFITTEPENAVPGKSLARPKTHTPGSRVEERGLRYYHPDEGRWLNRDPMGESLCIGLYVACNNGAVNHMDAIGCYTYSGTGGDAKFGSVLDEICVWLTLPQNSARYMRARQFLNDTFGYDLDAAVTRNSGPIVKLGGLSYNPWNNKIHMNLDYYSISTIISNNQVVGVGLTPDVAMRHLLAESLLHETAHHAADEASFFGSKHFVPSRNATRLALETTFGGVDSTDMPSCQYEGYFIEWLWEGLVTWPE